MPSTASKVESEPFINFNQQAIGSCEADDVYKLLGGIEDICVHDIISIEVVAINEPFKGLDGIEVISDWQIDSMPKGAVYVTTEPIKRHENKFDESGLLFELDAGFEFSGPAESSKANSRDYRICYFKEEPTGATNYLFYALDLYIEYALDDE